MAKKKVPAPMTPFAESKKMQISDETYQSMIAQDVLGEALNEVKTKSLVHGDTVNSFTMISELWTTYIRHTSVVRNQTIVLPNDVAQMMAMLKLSRSVYGKSNDNYVDGAGYTALAAMLDPESEES